MGRLLFCDGLAGPRQGSGPAQKRTVEAAKAARRTEPTFEPATLAWHEKNRALWVTKTQKSWIASMRAHAFPVLGKLPVSAVSTAEVLKVIEPIWEKRKTATQLRARIEVVLAAAKVAGFVTGENPARRESHLDAILPKPSRIKPTVAHASMPHAEIPAAFMAELRGREGVPSRALEFVVLTGVRTNEALGAEWSEFDLDAAVWKIPGPRMTSSGSSGIR